MDVCMSLDSECVVWVVYIVVPRWRNTNSNTRTFTIENHAIYTLFVTTWLWRVVCCLNLNEGNYQQLCLRVYTLLFFPRFLPVYLRYWSYILGFILSLIAFWAIYAYLISHAKKHIKNGWARECLHNVELRVYNVAVVEHVYVRNKPTGSVVRTDEWKEFTVSEKKKSAEARFMT